VDLHPERLQDAIRRYGGYMPPNGDPRAMLGRLVEACDGAPDDAELVAIAVVLVDPLLDTYWEVIGPAFEAAMRSSRGLRKAFSCTMLDIPADLHRRLQSLVTPEDNIGGMTI
jgi:hypothetical protein